MCKSHRYVVKVPDSLSDLGAPSTESLMLSTTGTVTINVFITLLFFADLPSLKPDRGNGHGIKVSVKASFNYPDPTSASLCLQDNSTKHPNNLQDAPVAPQIL